MENVICADGIVKSFGGKTAVNGLSFAVKKGECFGLLGHNGAGKSTTMECILGLQKPDSGKGTIFGLEPAKNRKSVFERVGVQLQSTAWQQKIKVYELCEEISSLYEKPADYHELLERFGLTHTLKQMVATMSGGEKQKLSVLLALLPNPEVLFLDELTTGLDAAARREVWKMLKSLKKSGVTMLLTSHFMDEVEALCDRAVIIKDGAEIAAGTIAELTEKSPYDDFEKAYLWYMGEEDCL